RRVGGHGAGISRRAGGAARDPRRRRPHGPRQRAVDADGRQPGAEPRCAVPACVASRRATARPRHRAGSPAHRRPRGRRIMTADMAWGRTRRLALREFADADRDPLVAMHQDVRLRAHLVDDYPLHEPAVARLFLARMAALYRRHEGLGIWHATRLDPQPAFAGWFSLMPMAERPGE